MPKIFTLLTLAQPQNLGGALADGGSLAPNTTYYYQVLAVRREYSAPITFSPRSASFSITTNATQKKVNLTWDAIAGFTPSGDYQCYIVLRNTADSFPDNLSICIMKPGATYKWNPVQTNSFTDDGTYTMGQICHFKEGLPTVLCTQGTSGDPITMWDVYQADLGGGWGRIKPALDSAFMEFDSWKREGMTWVIHANLLFGYNGSSEVTTYFSHLKQGGLIIYGGLHYTAVCYVTFGEKVNVDDANVSNMPFVLVHGPSQMEYCTIQGVDKLYGLRIVKGGLAWGSYAFSSWNNPYHLPGIIAASGSEILDCDFAEKGNGYNLSASAAISAKGCRFPGVKAHANVSLIKPKIMREEGLGLRHNTGATITEATITYSSYDIIWQTGLIHTLIDCLFQSHQQTDNRPWLYLGYGLALLGSLTFKNTFKVKVCDQQGNPLTGVTVTIKNALGETVYSDTTGADGKVDAGAMTTRVLTPDANLQGVWNYGPYHEDTMVSNGKLVRVMHTPHNLTLEKAGYETYQEVITVDRKMDMEVGLRPYQPRHSLEVELPALAPLKVSLSAARLEVELNG